MNGADLVCSMLLHTVVACSYMLNLVAHRYGVLLNVFRDTCRWYDRHPYGLPQSWLWAAAAFCSLAEFNQATPHNAVWIFRVSCCATEADGQETLSSQSIRVRVLNERNHNDIMRTCRILSLFEYILNPNKLQAANTFGCTYFLLRVLTV